ncbi:hypothetical protein ABPG74_008237 [Tetrahymena malaccensis]
MAALPQYETLSGNWVSPHIFHIQLNRPDRMNAFNPKMFEEIPQAFEFLSKQDELRVVVLTGNGKHFSSGLDLNEAFQAIMPESDDTARKTIKLYETIKILQHSIDTLNRCRVPVLVGIHGACVGAGINFACSADIRYCTKDVKISIKEVDIGICADIGVLQRLPLQTGNDSLLREITYTGRFISAEEALKLGVVSKVSENFETMIKELIEVAQTIASKSPVAVWTIKQALNHDVNKAVAPNLEYMARVNAAMIQTTDMQESVTSFLTKKKAVFPKL